MEKVKITQQQADAIVNTRRFNSDLFIVMKCLEYGDNFETIPNIDTETLIRALYIGYEVEQTPEDRVAQLLVAAKEQEKMLDDHPQATYWRGKQQGILDTLLAYGINIKGVNAE